MPWYKVTLTVDQASEYLKLQDQFTQIFMVVHNRGEMALLDSGYTKSDMQNIYFTPGCIDHPAMKALMDKYGAVPCDEPTRETESELGLLVGVAGKWDVWCPDLP